ncbi:hypothetical protein niasHT_031033 [Heterodera trifolii]|uniref:14-3-3 domain-containing protein n=1 Tax=Heterodera trifolii TaxID=157864 RepID=A0ABD2HVE3_9BILA
MVVDDQQQQQPKQMVPPPSPQQNSGQTVRKVKSGTELRQDEALRCEEEAGLILSLIRCDVLRVSVLQQQQLVFPLPILCQFPTMDKTKSYNFTVAKQMEAVFNFEQMVVAVQRMVQADAKLDKNERTFLARAYKKLIDVRRETWRFFCNIDENPQDADKDEQKQVEGVMTDLRLKTHEELRQLYREFLVNFGFLLISYLFVSFTILGVINEKLLPNANDEEANVFYHNMKGDFYRDQVDLLEEDEHAVPEVCSFRKSPTKKALKLPARS